jgi:hypothetical protein
MNQLAETGWQQMHKMLVEHGLSTEIPSFGSSKKRTWFLVIAAAIFLFIIFSYPLILNDKYQLASNSNTITNPGHILSNSKHTSSSDEEKPVQPSLNKEQVIPAILKEKELARERIKAAYLQFRRDQAIATLQNQKKFLFEKFTEKISKTTLPESDNRIDTTTILNPLPIIPKTLKPKAPRKVQFFAGAGINISEGDKNSFSLHNFNIHPGFTVVIPVTNKLSLHTGLWAFSTLHKKEASTKERELVNTINPYYNINTTSIVKASYFDLPLTLHYSINKNWSVGSGLELSKLYRINIKEKKESYNYNNLLVSSTVNMYNPTPGRAAAIFQKKVEVKNYEPRFVLETNFSYHNWLFSAGYHYGLDKTITLKDVYNASHHYRNEYFKCGVQYRIRWRK